MTPGDHTETPRDNSSAAQPNRERPRRPARQIAPPLAVDGPEAIRDSNC